MTARLVALLLLTAPAAAAGADTVVVLAGADAVPKVVAPFGVDFVPDGSVYFVEMAGGERLRAVGPDGIIRVLAGTGAKGLSGDGGPGAAATFNGMHGLAVGPGGVVYLADTWNNCVRTIDPKTGTVARFAGTGEKGFAGDGGPAAAAKFGGVFGLAFDAKKTALYIADLDNRRVRKIDLATKTVTTVAGTGKSGVPADGEPAAGQPLVDPRAVAVDPAGTVYVLERGGHALRHIDATTGRVFTAAGTGKAGSGAAQMNGPKHLCIDPTTNPHSVLIADTENHRVVRYTPSAGGAELTPVAGTGRKGSKLDPADPTRCELFQPHGVAVHPTTGDLYVADSGNNRVLRISR